MFILCLYIIFVSIIIYRSFINISNLKLNVTEAAVTLALINIITIVLDNVLYMLPFGIYQCLPIIIINICLVILYYIKVKKIIIGTILTILSTIILVISDYIVDWIKMGFFEIDLALNITTTVTSLIVDCVMVYVVATFISYIIGKFFRKTLSMMELYFRFKTSVLVLIILSLTLLIYYGNIILNENYAISNKLVKFNSILFLAYFVTLILIIYSVLITVKKEIQFKNDKIHLQNLREYTSNLESVHSSVKKFRHDYINILSSLTGYIEADDMEGLKKFFYENILPLSEKMNSNNFKLCSLKNVGIMELKGILSSKIIVAKEKGIDLTIDIFEPITEISINTLDLCRIMGIVLDNAIEGAMQCEKPYLKLGIIKRGKSIFIVIINNYEEDIPSISNLFVKGFSTKGKNRGLGLSNLREILEKYKNAVFDVQIKNNEFIQTLEIYSMEGYL